MSVRCIDHNKGDKGRLIYRSRLVGQDYGDGKCEEMLAATLPLEALRMVVPSSVTGSEPGELSIADVSRAYMYARCDTPMHVKLCAEDTECGWTSADAASWLKPCTEPDLQPGRCKRSAQND